MPPQQRERLLDLVGDVLGLGAHISPASLK
jgi:hypothetical protein